jgi:hypothetical protein
MILRTNLLYIDQKLCEVEKHIKILLNSNKLDYLEYRKAFKSIDFNPDEILKKCYSSPWTGD